MRRVVLALFMALGASLTSACGDDSSGSPAVSQAADPSGTWLGTLKVGSASLRVVFNIVRDSDRGFSGTLDSPDQGAFGIPVTRIDFAEGRITLTVDSIAAVFTGALSADGQTLSGTLAQSGSSHPLTLEKQPGPLDYRRPQDPVAPFPYNAVEVTFPSDDAAVSLAGTLLWPNGAGPFPTVVLITGSGPQNRNEELSNHRPFLVLADALARANIAVLRYDDRGVGASTGDFNAGTTEDFARDARGAVRFLKSQPNFAPSSIGLVGHSEGGEVAPIAAEDNPDVAFLVLLAGPGVDGKTTLISQGRAIAAAQGTAPAELDIAEAQLELVYGCFTPQISSADLQSCLRPKLTSLGADVETTIATLDTPWMRFFVSYDPAPVLRRTSVPVLALNGSLDLQVLPDLNLPAIDAALRDGGNEQHRAQKLAGLNHLFQHATTGLPSEYGNIDETMAPEVLTLVADWIHQNAPNAP